MREWQACRLPTIMLPTTTCRRARRASAALPITTSTRSGRGTRPPRRPWRAAASRRSRRASPRSRSRITWTSPPGSTATRSPSRGWIPDRSTRMRLLDLPGYLGRLDECRRRYPDLRILSGVEIGEAHLWGASAAAVLASADIERVLGSLHAIPFGGRLTAADQLFQRMPADEVMRRYFAELVRLVEGSGVFEVLAHLDFPRRMWPRRAGAYDETRLRGRNPGGAAALAASGRVLEVNTKSPLALGRASPLVAGGRRAGGVVRQRRAPALAGRRQVQAGGRCGRGCRLPRRARSFRLLAPVGLHCRRRRPGRPSAGGDPGRRRRQPQVQVSPKRATISSHASSWLLAGPRVRPLSSRAVRGMGMDRLWQCTAKRNSV